MTPIHTETRTSQATRTHETEQLLRDAAFILKLTKRVKDDILRSAGRSSDRTPALVV